MPSGEISAIFSRASFGGSASCASRTRRSPSAQADRELLRLEREGAAVLAEHPAGERLDRGVLGLEDAVRERAGLVQRPVHPPGGVAVDLDLRRALNGAVLPVLADAVGVDVEVRREAEVALAAGGEADVAAHAGDAEGADVVVVEIVADDVPGAAVAAQCVRDSASARASGRAGATSS